MYMAGQYSFNRRLRGLSIALLAVQCLCVLSKPTARDTASSILAESNRVVPDYVTQYGMKPTASPDCSSTCGIHASAFG